MVENFVSEKVVVFSATTFIIMYIENPTYLDGQKNIIHNLSSSSHWMKYIYVMMHSCIFILDVVHWSVVHIPQNRPPFSYSTSIISSRLCTIFKLIIRCYCVTIFNYFFDNISIEKLFQISMAHIWTKFRKCFLKEIHKANQ